MPPRHEPIRVRLSPQQAAVLKLAAVALAVNFLFPPWSAYRTAIHASYGWAFRETGQEAAVPLPEASNGSRVPLMVNQILLWAQCLGIIVVTGLALVIVSQDGRVKSRHR
jgi:hypothetical protein